MTRLRIALLANLKRNAPHVDREPPDAWAELDSMTTVEAIIRALESVGHEAFHLEGDASLTDRLHETAPDFCFNLCEGHRGDGREAQVPGVLELLGIPYSGSRVVTLAVTLEKHLTKMVLEHHGLPTAPFQLFHSASDALRPDLGFPLFVKPVREGTGIGVNGRSRVAGEGELREQVAWLLQTYRQPALVEAYIPGREITVGLVGNFGQGQGPVVLPALEIDLSDVPPEENGIYTSRIKADLPHLPRYLTPAPIPNQWTERLGHLAVETFRALDCLDVARVDFRVTPDGKPYILELNPLPGLNPELSDLVFEARAAGWSHAELILRITDSALRRWGLALEATASAAV